MGEPSRRVGIVGLGLIGGSLARDLIARGVDVIAYDREFDRLRKSADPVLARVRLVESVREVAAAESVVIAVPVAAALSVLEALVPVIGSAHLIMDVGGTKAAVVAQAETLGIGQRFIGCHPLAGDHRSGWEASRTGLFADATIFLCRPASAGDDRALAAERFWRSLDALPLWMEAETHDRRLAFSSHLPHMLAAALALTLQDAGVARAELGPGGSDMTRLSASSPELWTDIAVQNADVLSDALRACETTLLALRIAVQSRDAQRIVSRLSGARGWSCRE